VVLYRRKGYQSKEVVKMFDLMPFAKNNNNSVFNYLDDLESNFFGDLSTNISQFRTDVIDKGDHYELKADLPGFTKGEIKIDLKNDTLSISAEHKEENEEKDDSGTYVRRERKYGSFFRSFDVSGIDQNKIDAEYKDGVLSLTLPKEVPKEPASTEIEIR
jgi:Molecular chaperone (small heat shock protein)